VNENFKNDDLAKSRQFGENHQSKELLDKCYKWYQFRVRLRNPHIFGANERWSHILNNGSVKSQIAGIFFGKITDIKWHFVAPKKP
jgi:hypothetical protein